MNSVNLQNNKPGNDGRRPVAGLSLLFFISVALISVAAQSRTKRITSIFTATSAEGARVHVISDSPVSDYEAYKRGDRFYVKIPKADLPTARGSLLGRGFDDVQIQRYGDGIILSFHLQPGTTARVVQNVSRLEIIFATPGGRQSSPSQSASAEAISRTRARRTSDAAGPSPSDPVMQRSTRQPAARRDVSSESPRKSTTVRSVANPVVARTNEHNRGQSRVGGAASRSSKPDAKKPSESRAPEGATHKSGSSPAETNSGLKKVTPSPSPLPTSKASPGPQASPSPAPSASPTPPVAGALTSASPLSSPSPIASPTAPEPSLAASPVPVSTTGSIDWAAKAHYWKVWAELNWLPLVIGGLIGLALLVLMFSWHGMKRRRSVTGSATQPRPAPGVTVATKESAAAPVVIQQPQPPATATANSSESKPVGKQRQGGEDQEREVFEL